MKGLFAAWGSLVCAALSFGCQTTDPGAGSNTNWLLACDTDAVCGDKLSCLCGVCTALCDDSCADLPNAVCAAPGSAQQRELCGPDAVSAPPTMGMCLPACGRDTACASGQLCVDGGCLQMASTDDAASGCVTGAQLQVSSAGVALQARYGTVFGDGLYLPVAYDARPADWTEPMTPTPIVATVTTPEGDAVRGCAVRFIAGDGNGQAFADQQVTDKHGQIAAYWVAGDQRRQTLTAALVDQQGNVQSQSIAGTAYANDEGPRSTDAAATVATRPATVNLSYDLPDGAKGLRVLLSAATFPHHAFYAAIDIDGFFAGLQNTSDLDAATDTVADDDRVLIASVWNVAEGDAQQLFSADGVVCSPHQQDLGGIRCTLAGAWQPGQDYLFTLERATLATGETPAGYAALGYPIDACASSAGCTDLTLFFSSADAPADLQRLVAYRYQSGVAATSFGSFIQPYLELPSQNSCLLTPEYAAHFKPEVLGDLQYDAVTSADFSATYASWHNEVCANYDATTDTGGFDLVTGGSRPLGRPELPDEPARPLTLP